MLQANEGKVAFDPFEVVGLESFQKLVSIDNKWNGRGNSYRPAVRVSLSGGHAIEVFDISLAELAERIAAAKQADRRPH